MTVKKIDVELDLFNYATKYDLKNGIDVDTSTTKNDDLANLKTEVDKLDIDKLAELDADKLKPVPVDFFKKINYVVDKRLLKKMYIMQKSKTLKIKYLIFLI